MKDANVPFIGFTYDAAKKSLIINRVLTNVINRVESDIKLITSTPKSKRSRMEISFSKCYENAAKYESNFCITMDYDSGYISHNQESNSDSSLENLSEIVANSLPPKPIYLSEDALLEKPEVSTKFHNLTAEIEKEDYEETKNIFNSPDILIPSSNTSQKTSYSGFENDSDSNVSIEIPKLNQIIFDTNNTELTYSLNVNNDVNCSCSDYSVNISKVDGSSQEEYLLKSQGLNRLNAGNDEEKKNISENMNIFLQNILSEEKEECSISLALDNITNISSGTVSPKNSDNKKKLTLIFSKDNKENMYSVKRKYRSITPDKSLTPDKWNRMLEKSLTPEIKITPIKIETNERERTQSEKQVPNKDFQEKMGDFEKCVQVISQESNVTFENSFSRQSALKNSSCLEKSVTPVKKFENRVDPNISPDLFFEEEILQEAIKEVVLPPNYIAEEKYIIKKDHKVLKRAQHSLKGVLPPLSVTVVQLSIDEMLNRLESNQDYYWTNSGPIVEKNVRDLNSSSESNINESRSLLITGALDDCVKMTFPSVMNERYHGLHHNRSKISEEFEELCAKYGQRYVGAETQSTCTVFETNFISPTKRKQLKQRWAVKSPGRRLSHLARRRITFSSANLQAGATSVANSRARQILVDAKKLDLLNRRRSPRKSPRKTPKKTPGKSPRVKTRTPSSSAKKKLAMRFRELTGEIEKTVPSISNNLGLSSKRALFHSPDRDKKSNLFLPSTSGLSTFKNDLKKPTTKRALFMSPSKNSPLKHSPFKRSPFKRLDLGMEKKRKRSESDDTHPTKLSRTMSMDIRPSESEVKTTFNRAKSEMSLSLNRNQAGQSGELSAIHKKKLQWAVYEALRSQNITPAHSQFKIFASILARVTRRFLPNLSGNAPRPEGGTSDRMLRIARHHVYAVVKGKSVDEIISEYLRNRPRNIKPQGYVGIEEFNNEKGSEMVTNKENIIQSKDTQSLERKKLECLGKPAMGNENRIDRIRKVINFGDDNR